ncbi:MAG: family 20 glycosylhydrolase, partial [Pseudoxanthomonas sp.]
FNVEEETFAFLSNVFAEVAELFPSRYIHIGADEAVKTQWQKSPRVQSRMRELGIADEAALQSWFVRRLEKILADNGRRLIGWDEILEGGLPPEATVMSWRGIDGGIEAARQGHDVVMSPVSSMYLDYLQTASPNEPAGRPKLIPLESFYTFEPVPEALTAAERTHILGLQANMWTGDTRGFAGVEHNTFPRLAAVAETGWTLAPKKDYASFLQRLPEQLHRYQMLDIGYAQTPFEVMAEATPLSLAEDSSQGNARVTLSNPLGYPIQYTLEAGQSAPAWLDYRQPLQLPLPANLRVATFADGKAIHSVQRFDFTHASLLDRSDEGLTLCTTDGPVLRMEDDGPAEGPRALFNVAIFEPCWKWVGAPIDGITAVRVRAGRLPYLIQLGDEDSKRRFLPAETAHGELDVRMDGCDGPRLASAPLPAGPDGDGFITLQASLIAPGSGLHDLCIRFSGDTRPDMWVLDRITLLPSKQE